MQFFTVKDESSVSHKVLVVPLTGEEMNELMAQCKTCMPSINISSMVQNGHPYVIVDFGSGGSYKTALALDEVSEDGDKIGDELRRRGSANGYFDFKRQTAQGFKRQSVLKCSIERFVGV